MFTVYSFNEVRFSLAILQTFCQRTLFDSLRLRHFLNFKLFHGANGRVIFVQPEVNSEKLQGMNPGICADEITVCSSTVVFVLVVHIEFNLACKVRSDNGPLKKIVFSKVSKAWNGIKNQFASGFLSREILIFKEPRDYGTFFWYFTPYHKFWTLFGLLLIPFIRNMHSSEKMIFNIHSKLLFRCVKSVLQVSFVFAHQLYSKPADFESCKETRPVISQNSRSCRRIIV